MPYDLADIAKKLRMNPETIAHRTLAEAFLQAVGTLDRLNTMQKVYRKNHDLKGVEAIETGRAWDAKRQAGMVADKELDGLAADPRDEEIAALRARLADAEERLRGFAGVNT
jgi:hypothetical protein